jgi:hypothetical protein
MIHREMHIGLLLKWLLKLLGLNENWNGSTVLCKTSLYRISWVRDEHFSSCFLHTDRWRDRLSKVNAHYGKVMIACKRHVDKLRSEQSMRRWRQVHRILLQLMLCNINVVSDDRWKWEYMVVCILIFKIDNIERNVPSLVKNISFSIISVTNGYFSAVIIVLIIWYTTYYL